MKNARFAARGMLLIVGFWLFLGLCIGWARPALALPGGKTLKVLSLNFNAEIFLSDRDQRIQAMRIPRILQWIRQNDPDVVLIQEAWSFHADPSVALTLGRALNYDVAYRLDMGAPGFMYDSVAILAKKSLHMSEEKDIVLPHSAKFSGDGKTWVIVTGAVTVAVGVVVRLPDGTPVWVYTSHLGGANDAERKDQLTAMDQAIRGHVAQDHADWNTAHVIAGGDLNSYPDYPSIQYMKSQGYEDTWAAAHPELVSTGDEITDCGDPTSAYFNPFAIGAGMFPSQNDPGSRACGKIDYIFAHGPDHRTLASTVTFTSPTEGLWMSDHYGVLSTIAFDGDRPATLPANPARDSAPLPATALLEITPKLLRCAWDDGCSKMLPERDAYTAKGLTVVNSAALTMRVGIYGPRAIVPYSNVALKTGEGASFSFLEPGEYRYRITDEQKDDIEGVLRVLP
jgi:endonuclease/exonuclease/phosphatase family metal-dependent hydrolase